MNSITSLNSDKSYWKRSQRGLKIVSTVVIQVQSPPRLVTSTTRVPPLRPNQLQSCKHLTKFLN
jgi:hypothetical protein